MDEHTHKINLSQMEAEQRYLLPKCSSDIIIVSDLRTGVTGKSIPPAGLYPGLKRPRLDYTPVYYGLGQFVHPQAKIYPHDINHDINSDER